MFVAQKVSCWNKEIRKVFQKYKNTKRLILKAKSMLLSNTKNVVFLNTTKYIAFKYEKCSILNRNNVLYSNTKNILFLNTKNVLLYLQMQKTLYF